MNESELIKRCLKKEKIAWDIFVQRYSNLIYWVIRKRLTMSSFEFDKEDVNGIFQEVFLSILEDDKLSQIKDSKLISGWLAMIASNKTVDFMRKKIREGQRLVLDMPVLKDEKLEQELSDRDTINIIKNIINTLSAKEKIIISLNILEGRTHKEIANIIGIPINTVSTIIARTKEKLKKELRKRGIKNNT